VTTLLGTVITHKNTCWPPILTLAGASVRLFALYRCESHCFIYPITPFKGGKDDGRMLRANELRPGKVVTYEGTLYTVKESTHVAKGNKRSYIQVKLKNFKSGQIIDHRARVDDTFETPFVQSKEYEYLYFDGNNYIMADVETYDQIPISAELIGEGVQFLKDNIRITCDIIDGQIVSVALPHVVELKITETVPAIKGATATNQNKDADLETGARIKVPPFIEIGEVVRVDTRTGQYIERAK